MKSIIITKSMTPGPSKIDAHALKVLSAQKMLGISGEIKVALSTPLDRNSLNKRFLTLPSPKLPEGFA